MISLGDRVPAYLLGKYQMIMTVNFTALFSLVFILASIPFSHNPWFEMDVASAISFTVIFFCIAVLVVILSKRMLYSTKDKFPITFAQYILWNLGEVIIICCLYTFFTVEAHDRGLIDMGDTTTLNLFLNSFKYLVISVAIPYILAGMYFDIQDKDNTIRMINYGSVVSDETLMPYEENKITLFDNNGALKLSVSASNLYYIESDDNYIKVWYADNSGVLKQYMLRCRLKTIEDSFKDSDLMRCHRKYVVNMSKVKVLSKVKDGYQLDLGLSDIDPIPVSKTYEDKVVSCFNSR